MDKQEAYRYLWANRNTDVVDTLRELRRSTLKKLVNGVRLHKTNNLPMLKALKKSGFIRAFFADKARKEE